MERVMERVKKEDGGGKKRRGRRGAGRGIYRPLWPAEINWEGMTLARKNRIGPLHQGVPIGKARVNSSSSCETLVFYSWLEVSSVTT